MSRRAKIVAQPSPEGEGEGFDAGVEEVDREGPVADGAFLADQLVEALAGDRAAAVGGDVGRRRPRRAPCRRSSP